jgi:hypothetical protein
MAEALWPFWRKWLQRAPRRLETQAGNVRHRITRSSESEDQERSFPGVTENVEVVVVIALLLNLKVKLHVASS